MTTFALLMTILVLLITVFVLKSKADSPPYCDDGYPIIIVGSGLAGHSAAAELISILKSENKLSSTPIVVFDKESKFGGNSNKATSGINGANTEFQKAAKINDNPNIFAKDTYYSSIAGKLNDNDDYKINDLIKTLTSSSASAVNWLKNEFNLQLTAITQCGGHSIPRTHRPPSGPAGHSIVKAVHTKIENDVEFRYQCKVIDILMDRETKTVIGVKYIDLKDDNKIKQYFGKTVILTTGGFGNDHEDDSLLTKYSTMNEDELPTTNGDWATGDGVKIGNKIGAKLIDMKEIQIHPTGFINPKKPDDKTKFLAPEALRGLGGIIINNKGERFVNELDLRANVVEKMRKEHNTPFRLILTEKMTNDFGPNVKFYIKFGLIKEYENIYGFSKDVNIDENVIISTIKQYIDDSKNGYDKFGKTVFINGDTFDINDKFYVAQITPVIHYTMGGLEINNKAQILDINDDIINGLYGAGEVTGGVHGKNRLAGNSLLECVVYGRIAAQNAVKYCKHINKEKKLHHTEL